MSYVVSPNVMWTVLKHFYNVSARLELGLPKVAETGSPLEKGVYHVHLCWHCAQQPWWRKFGSLLSPARSPWGCMASSGEIVCRITGWENILSRLPPMREKKLVKFYPRSPQAKEDPREVLTWGSNRTGFRLRWSITVPAKVRLFSSPLRLSFSRCSITACDRLLSSIAN